MEPWSTPEVIAALSKESYGDELATRLWTAMEAQPVDSGIINHHRDYCGIGLMRTAQGVTIARFEDGFYVLPLLSWTNLPEFVAYWSQQSDFGQSGADARYPELWAKSDFERNNQRITRARILEFLERQSSPAPTKLA